jgi:hypothetical protein
MNEVPYYTVALAVQGLEALVQPLDLCDRNFFDFFLGQVLFIYYLKDKKIKNKPKNKSNKQHN